MYVVTMCYNHNVLFSNAKSKADTGPIVYHIFGYFAYVPYMLFICGEKLSLFHIFTFIPWKTFAVTSYHQVW